MIAFVRSWSYNWNWKKNLAHGKLLRILQGAMISDSVRANSYEYNFFLKTTVTRKRKCMETSVLSHKWALLRESTGIAVIKVVVGLSIIWKNAITPEPYKVSIQEICFKHKAYPHIFSGSRTRTPMYYTGIRDIQFSKHECVRDLSIYHDFSENDSVS